ncbi:hypothetical protein LBMAG42_37380 [Deltaproteobacteria bacterium]|nr:hypothetical protein LBMAG42_37380 [Deltaproteobacteria bacterium]
MGYRTTVLLLRSACALHPGTTGLSAELSTGIGGLVVNAGDDDGAREAEGWARFQTTDADYRAWLAWPARRDDVSNGDFSRWAQARDALEAQLVEVVNVGAGRPGIAALVRIGLVYEAADAWLRAEPVVSGPNLPAPVGSLASGCPVYSQREKALSAFRTAARLGWQLRLHGDPNLQVAVEHLSRLAPDEFPPRYERLPTDRPSFEE